MFVIQLILLILNVFISKASVADFELHESNNIMHIIEDYGYHLEIHKITTRDGYILQTFRVRKEKCDNKPVVFVQHGLFNSGEHYLVFGPNKSLGLILADSGYDVWLGNSRGTRYSRNHLTLNPDEDVRYWDFSFHEMGYYDLPANIDYILEHTKQEYLYYVGHSQGTSSFYVMASTIPSYNKKIKAQFSMSCIVYMNSILNPVTDFFIKAFSVRQFLEDILIMVFPMNEVSVPLELTYAIGHTICASDSSIQLYCKLMLHHLNGFSEEELDLADIPRILEYTPSAISLKDLKHYFQLAESGYFRPYDYGFLENLLKYGSFTPPNYNLAKISTDMYIIIGEKDFMLDYNEIIQRTSKQFANVQEVYLLPDFNHNDFVFGRNAKELIYDKIICTIEDYEKGSDSFCFS